MFRLAPFDVGETLIHAGRPIAGVAEALAAIARLEAAPGRPLPPGIVSDYFDAGPPPTEAAIEARERQFRDEVLGPSGLARFFEPFDERVTLSSRAGVRKPDRAIFDLAVARSRTGATLGECLFVTEAADHVRACRDLGMAALQFGDDFSDWADAPALLAALVAPGDAAAMARAVAPQLAARHGLVGFVPLKAATGVRGHANRLVPLHDPRLGALDGVLVEVPAAVTADIGPDHRVTDVRATAPDPGAVAESVEFVVGLVRAGQVALGGPTPGATHAIERDDAGRMRLVRRVYSAR